MSQTVACHTAKRSATRGVRIARSLYLSIHSVHTDALLGGARTSPPCLLRLSCTSPNVSPSVINIRSLFTRCTDSELQSYWKTTNKHWAAARQRLILHYINNTGTSIEAQNVNKIAAGTHWHTVCRTALRQQAAHVWRPVALRKMPRRSAFDIFSRCVWCLIAVCLGIFHKEHHYLLIIRRLQTQRQSTAIYIWWTYQHRCHQLSFTQGRHVNMGTIEEQTHLRQPETWMPSDAILNFLKVFFNKKFGYMSK